ncbi:restriction endonuclease subunit S [Staphylococcus schleiferi subsp. coagulans]|uniref:restriction endonuclease subunit S n=1 Tax=Staphylococcus coagulans TaxID=74706 RepID=UPI0015FCED2A|nr:restriction endonuclease subunit S [Staphylococcus coagulans]MBA8759957.1 restriction endonuclease subunit S [Staphylococcus coagulans]MBA8768604.1 restriction endonuclease subunit S [Staphylococcus coagulans]
MEYDKHKIKFKDFIELKRGYDLPTKDRIEGNIPIISSSGVSGTHHIEKVKGPGVITGRSGLIGSVYYENKDFWPLNTTLYVKNFKGNNPKYVYYFLKTMNLKSFQTGSSVPTLNRNHLDNIEVTIHEKNKQVQQIKVLDNIDNKIINNKKIIANLEELSQTLFKRWFVDFEFPDENGNPYKSSGGELIDSELGNIPKLWSIIKTKDLFKIHSGYAFKSKWWNDNGYNVIKIKDINNKSIDVNGLDKVKEDYVKKASKFKVYGGEILIALTGATAGKMGVVPKLKQTAFVNQRVGLITSNVDNVYIYHLLNSDRIKKLTLEHAIGSAQANISPVKFGNIKIICADKKIIDRYCQLTKNNYEKIVELHSENNYLTQLRDTLLPKLMSGEVEIPEDIEVNEDELSI